MFKAAYEYFRRIRSFNKIFISFAAVITAALMFLTATVSFNMTNMLLKREIRYSTLILSEAEEHFESKLEASAIMQKQAYEEDSGMSPAGYMDTLKKENKGAFISYWKSAFTRDPEALSIEVYSSKGKIRSIFKKSGEIEEKIIEGGIQRKNIQGEKGFSSVTLPCEKDGRYIGYIKITYSTVEIDNIIKKNYAGNAESVFIFSPEGKTVFDMSGKYYKGNNPFKKYLDENSTFRYNNKEYLAVTYKSSNMKALGIFPVENILKDMRTTKSILFFIALVFILLAIGLAYYSKDMYIKRVQFITDGMKRVRKGDLSGRIPIDNSLDEIKEISEGFNQMCDDLERYIDKVYISDIKQKKAELIAFQNQINPHFLYNTLEVIRMNAVLNGADEAGEMIQVLSKLFRNLVKMDMIVDAEDEIRNVSLYLDLFKIRYGEKLSVNFDVDPEVLRCGIVKHLIQPVVENYIVHGFDGSRDDNRLDIRGFKNGDFIIFEITDNASGIDEELLKSLREELENPDYRKRDSIGLANVNDRIKLIYGKECGMEIVCPKSGGTEVRIKLQARTKEELWNYVQGAVS